MFFQQVINGLTLGAIYTLVALSFSFVMGILGILNMANAELFMMGGYLAFVAIERGVPLYLALPIAMGGAALLGLVVLLQFNPMTVGLGVASLLLVAIYPFMKRITWWPQLFLGLAFSWGALVGWTSQTGSLDLPPLVLYLGCILWVIGYDTIYALQDVEDDALIGVKSTARLFGTRAREIVALFYGGAVALWGIACLLVGAGPVLWGGLLLVIGGLGWQIVTLDPGKPANGLARFKANHWIGLVLTAALIADWWLWHFGS